MGLIGTFEGYIPTATDLYLRGKNIAGFETNGRVYLDTGQITVQDTGGNSALYGSINFVGYSKFNIEFYRGIVYRYSPRISLVTTGINSYTIASVEYSNTIGNHTVSLDVSNAQISARIGIGTYGMAYDNQPAAIYRIWLS